VLVCARYVTVCAVCGRYVTVLVELTRIEGTKHGRLIAAQLLDVAIRVQAVRAFVVVRMVRTISDTADNVTHDDVWYLMRFCLTGPIPLCLDSFLCMYVFCVYYML